MKMQLIQKNNPENFLLRRGDSPDVEYRLRLFVGWMHDNNFSLLDADLSLFRDAMLAQGYAKRSVQAMLSTTRERMRDLIRSNEFVTSIKTMMWERNREFSPAELELQLQAVLRQMENNADSRNSRLKDTVLQDRMDDERVWLNGEPMNYLLEHIGDGKHPNIAIRDRAIMAMFLATGIRREELCNLIISDLHKSYQGEAALLVREGKGNKQRAVPYGAMWKRFITPYVLPWLNQHEFKETDPVFQAYWHGSEKLRHRPLNPASINKIFLSFRLPYEGKWIHPTPHALRRTYARMLFQEYGLSTEGIQQNMGHSQIRTTHDYIGILDINFRIPVDN